MLNITDTVPLRRMPVYILVDHSQALLGSRVVSLGAGIQYLHQNLKDDPLCAAAVYLSVIDFADQVQRRMLTPVDSFHPPQFEAGGGSSFGAALHTLLSSGRYDIIANTPDKPGDIKPLVFLLQGTLPSDRFDDDVNELAKVVLSGSLNVFGVALNGAVSPLLRRITKVVLLADVSVPAAIPAIFEWILASIRVGVQFAASAHAGTIELPPLPQGIRLC